MEMTLRAALDPGLADFSNRTPSSNGFFPLPTISWMLISVFAGPGAAAAAGRVIAGDRSHLLTDSVESGDIVSQPDLAASQIAAIREGWRLNVTELAEIMEVQRPTIYNWLNGKTFPSAETRQKLDLLLAAAPVWNRLTTKSSDSFLLDYTGPDEVGPSIRQRMKSPACSLAELNSLIPQRIEQYREARARSLALLGERPSAATSAPSEGAWRLNRQWAQNAKALHRARKRAD
jgi:DNA-binding transcriptional regulator YiaG